ncbi:hypothetical protein M3Y95_00364500 [Aphelenchoides besseyi]|nr:hypothetical protein M3Y95_00364500 [Aphelenchoides besseyi]
MGLRFVLFASLLLTCRAKSISWPFYTYNNQSMFLDATIGTPGQFVRLWLSDNVLNNDDDGVNDDLKVSDARNGGIFNPDNSTSFVKTGNVYNYFGLEKIGIKGTETFKLGNGDVEVTKPLKVLNEKSYYFNEEHGQVSFGRSKNSASFIESILSDLDEKVVVFSFDDVDDDMSGVLTLGARPTDRCANDWILVPEHVFDEQSWQQWAVEIDSLSIGKYSFGSPGQSVIDIYGSTILVPQSYYGQILRALQAGSLGEIDCDIQVDIVFTVEKQEIRIPPDDYVDRSLMSTFGQCYANIDPHFISTAFYLPNSILKRHCLLYDYAGISVGFATRIQQ